MKLLVQRESHYGTGRAAPRRYRQVAFDKFNEAISYMLNHPNYHLRLVVQDDDGTLTTLMLRESPIQVQGGMAFPPTKLRAYLGLQNGLYIHKNVLRKTSIRRKTS